jgi:hypothetical protein
MDRTCNLSLGLRKTLLKIGETKCKSAAKAHYKHNPATPTRALQIIMATMARTTNETKIIPLPTSPPMTEAKQQQVFRNWL